MEEMKSIKKEWKLIAQENNLIKKKEKTRDLIEKSNVEKAKIIGAIQGTLDETEIVNCFANNEVLNCRKKKIRTIGTYYYKMSNGGGEKVLANLLRVWCKMGYLVILYTDEDINRNDYTYPSVVKRVIVPKTENAYKRAHFWEKTLDENKVDVMVYHEWVESWMLWDMISIKTSKIPFVIYTHGLFVELYHAASPYYLNAYKFFAMSDLVITLSECNYKFYEISGCNVKLMNNPIPYELLDNSEVSKHNTNRILWIGRICKGKRLEDAIYALSIVVKVVENVELHIVGTGDENEMKMINDIVREEGLQKFVFFEGFHKEVKPFYLESDMMLMTSEREGYPTIVLESKAYGLPIVMYDLPYLTLTKDNKGVLKVAHGDVEGLAREIINVLKNKDKKETLAKEAYESFEYFKNYDLNKEWNEVFNSFEKEDNIENRDATETLMMSMLVDELSAMVSRMEKMKIDYEVGKNILKLPRKLKKMFKKLKRTEE